MVPWHEQMVFGQGWGGVSTNCGLCEAFQITLTFSCPLKERKEDVSSALVI